MKIRNQNQLIELFEKEYPLNSQESWDFSGFSFLSKKEKSLKVIICLDVNKEIVEKAIGSNVSLIVSHHPFCFAPSLEESIEIDSSKEELVNLLDDNNISCYSIHTPFDIAKKGTHYFLLKRLGLLDKKIAQNEFSSIVKYSSSFKSLIKLLKEKLQLEFVISNWEEPEELSIDRIYFSPGAGDIYEFIKYNKQNNCDLLITSDIKWNEQVVLNNLKIKFIMISHKSEDVFIEGIYELIKEKINKDIEVILEYKKDKLNKF